MQESGYCAMKIPVIIPIFNEIKTIKNIIQRVKAVNIEKEIIIVDDCSTDGSREILRQIKEDGIEVFFHQKNSGKGAALRTGFKHITGEIVIIQDADLEYNPQDYLKLIEPFSRDGIDVVYGSRFLKREYVPHCIHPFYLTHFIGNKMLNFLVNVLYNARITDMETCYKAFRAPIITKITIKANRFDFEPEITAKVLKQGCRVFEVPIVYIARGFSEGKHITWRDGFSALWTLFKYRIMD